MFRCSPVLTDPGWKFWWTLESGGGPICDKPCGCFFFNIKEKNAISIINILLSPFWQIEPVYIILPVRVVDFLINKPGIQC